MRSALRSALGPAFNALTLAITQAGAGGGTPEGLRLLAENGDTLTTEAFDQLITD